MNICFWRFAFFAACAFAIFSWNVKVAFLGCGKGLPLVVVVVASSSSVKAGAAAAFLCKVFLLSFLLLVLKDDVDIFVFNNKMESKEERGE